MTCYSTAVVMYFSLLFIVVGSSATSPQSLSQQRDDSPVTVSERYFARNLYQTLSLASGGGNLVVSPFSIYLLLAVLMEGAMGSARSQLLKVLGLDFENLRIQAFRNYVQHLLEEKENSVQLVSRIFVDKSFPVDQDFLSVSQKYYHTTEEILELANKIDAAKTINSYVMKNTNNTIRNIIKEEDLPKDASMVCISTIHVKESWTLPFPRGRTCKQAFHLSSPSQETISVDMMHMKDSFHYLWDGTLQTKILSMDLSMKGLKMVFFLPDQELWDLEENLSTLDIIPLLREIQSSPLLTVDVWIPTFRVEGDFYLEKTLKQMGLSELFASGAELTGISCCGGLRLSTVRQKTYIVVEENGVEASSATAAVLTNGIDNRQSHEFHADRPFAFYLLLDNVVLFQGRVVKPAS